MRSIAGLQLHRLPVLTAVVALAVPAAALAQQPPSRADLDVGRANSAPDRTSRLSVEGEIERGPCPLADPAFADTRVTFADVEFTGLPGIPAATLDPAWRDFAGQDMPVSNLCEVRDRAGTILRGLGYLAAVQIPPQRIEPGGTVRMDVLAARLVEVQLRGDTGNSERLIAAHLEKLTERPWFNSREAERHLLLLEDLPGYDVRLVLRSAQGQPGEVVGDVVIERRPVELIAGAQNLASRATGREGGFIAASLNDLIGLGDRTTLSYYNTFDWHEQRIFRAEHELALGSHGLRFGGSVLLGHSKPTVGNAPFETDTVVWESHLSYPLLRRQARSLFATAGLEVVDQELSFGSTLLSEDKLRVLYARIDHDMVDAASIRGVGGYSIRQPRWRAATSLEVRHGLSGLGASGECDPIAVCLAPNVPISNFAADPSSFVARFDGAFEYRPAPAFTVAVATLGQWADGSLLSYEQASLGNYTIGRGFDPGIALGDRAAGGSLELRYGSVFPRRANAVALEPFVFVDFAKAWIDGSGGAPDPRSALSAGGGVRGRWGEHVDFGVTLAVPLQRAGFQTGKGDARLLFTVTTRLLPWSPR
jgi:hemolysin activation/secretion protein